MVVPVGERYQQVLYLFKKKDGKLLQEALKPTLFVPMTGTAEDQREVKPDQLHPSLFNGGFEQLTAGEPTGWFYPSQVTVVTATDAPEGKRYVTFSNATPGRACRLLQGFAVDGRKVHEVKLTCMARGKNIHRERETNTEAEVMIVFFDENRAPKGKTFLQPMRDTFDWRRVGEKEVLKVPAAAREAIVYLGLFGATGELSLDDIQLSAVSDDAASAK